jgi:hypothetical protein
MTKYIKNVWYGYMGLIMLMISWYCNWALEGLRTHIFFFPQWLGLILFIDSAVYMRTETSLIKRNGLKFLWLFLISMPIWWIFEIFKFKNPELAI